MKDSFTRRELENWIAATRVDIDKGPTDYQDDQRAVRAWAASASNVLDMLEEFIKKS